MKLKTGILLIAVFLVFKCNQTGGDSKDLTAERAQIEERNAELGKAVAAGKAEEMVKFYTTNGIVLLPNGNRITGQAQLLDYWKENFTTLGMKKLELTTDLLRGGPDQLLETGRYQVSMTIAGEAVNRGGDFVAVWRKEDGQWKMTMDVWN